MPTRHIKNLAWLNPRKKQHKYERVGLALDRSPDYGLSHKEIVAKTGLSPKQVSRSLQTLKSKGLADRVTKPIGGDIRGNWVPMNKGAVPKTEQTGRLSPRGMVFHGGHGAYRH